MTHTTMLKDQALQKPENHAQLPVVLFHFERKGNSGENPDKEELKALALTLGYAVTEEFYQTSSEVNPHTFIGKGKVENLKAFIEQQSLADRNLEALLINQDLSPAQTRNLERALELPIFDRTELVLRIFEKHATTGEAKTQVELSKLKYELPRLTRLWTHLDREKGGTNVSKGMGEKQIHLDQYLIRRRISQLEKKLLSIQTQKNNQSSKRKECFLVALAGYTNVGKSSLLKALTHYEAKIANQLFSTLDSKLRALPTKTLPKIILSDTVGFIRNLPTQLIASFRSTLQVVQDADLILEVVDAKDPAWQDKEKHTAATLQEIGSDQIPRITVFNKIDLLAAEELFFLQQQHPNAIFVSAHQEATIQKLAKQIQHYFQSAFQAKKVDLDITEQKLLHFYYTYGVVSELAYNDTHLTAQVAMRLEDWRRSEQLYTQQHQQH